MSRSGTDSPISTNDECGPRSQFSDSEFLECAANSCSREDHKASSLDREAWRQVGATFDRAGQLRAFALQAAADQARTQERVRQENTQGQRAIITCQRGDTYKQPEQPVARDAAERQRQSQENRLGSLRLIDRGVSLGVMLRTREQGFLYFAKDGTPDHPAMTASAYL